MNFIEELIYECGDFFHRRHNHPRIPREPILSAITIKETSMSVTGITLPVIVLTLTLPTTRTDGTALPVSQIQSATILRDSGTGPAVLTTLNGPFTDGTATFNDVSPATGSDVYSFYVTDTAGTQGLTSPAVSIAVSGVQPLAQPSAGTLTAVAQSPAPATAPTSTGAATTSAAKA